MISDVNDENDQANQPDQGDQRERHKPADAVTLGKNAWAAPDDLDWRFSRSSGPGGQHVNTSSTKAEVRIAITAIGGIHPSACDRLRATAGHLLIPASDQLYVRSQEHRSQPQNKSACLARLRTLIEACEPAPRIRRKTKPTRASKERRLKGKREQSEKKQNRNFRDDDH